MNKYFLIALLIFPMTTHSMEKSIWSMLLSMFGLTVNSKKSPYIPEKIKLFRQQRSELQSKLLENKHNIDATNKTEFENRVRFYIETQAYSFHTRGIGIKTPANLDEYEKSTVLMPARIDGYPMIAAAILAECKSLHEKKAVITQLINLGFEPTEKDRDLAYLEFYERTPQIPIIKRTLLLLSNIGNDAKSPFAQLPIEIIKHIWSFVEIDTLIPLGFSKYRRAYQ